MKIREQVMELILQYMWTPLVALAVGFYKILHRHEREIANCAASQENLMTSVDEARQSRKEIYDRVDSVRTDLTAQHTKLRDEQREDFKEIRKMIGLIGK